MSSVTPKIYVGMKDDSTPAQLGLGDATLMPGQTRTWLLHQGISAIERVGDAVAANRIVSAVVRGGALPPDMPLLAIEFGGRILSEPAYADMLGNRLPGWTSKVVEQFGLVFSPSPHHRLTEEKRRSTEQVFDTSAAWWEIDAEDAAVDPEGWFGALGRDDVGGWVTILAAARARGGGRATVGNLAALGLVFDPIADSLFAARQAGLVHVTAAGLCRDQVEAGDFGGLGRFGEPFDLAPLAHSSARYCVALRIEAPIDPKVIIGSGTVFEQLGPGGAQNLVVAAPWHDTIDAGQIVTTVLPAWCMNQDRSSPSGEALRLTPLTFTGEMADQHALWADIARRRKEPFGQ